MANPFSNTTSSGLFGSAQPSSVFGQTSSQPGPQFGQSFPQAGPLFGQRSPLPGFQVGQAASQPGSLFGQTGSPGGLGTSTVFGSTLSTATSFPSQTPSFGQSGTAGVFGQTQTAGFGQVSASSIPSLFGQSSTVSGGSSSGLFGQSTTGGSGPTTSTVFAAFGQPVMTSNGSASLFGQTMGGMSAFGQPDTTTSSSSVFGRKTAFGQPTTTSSGSNLFGQAIGGPSAFGQSTTAGSSSSSFGQPVGGTTAFGQPATSSSAFFAQTMGGGSAFSQPTTSPSSSAGPFGQPIGGASVFGQPTSAPSSSSGPFGQPMGGASVFGQPNTAPSSSASPFGQPMGGASAFGQPTTTASSSSARLFGQHMVGASAFHSPTAASTGSSLTTQQTATAVGSTGHSTSFGQPSSKGGLFTQQTVATTSLFGQPASASGTSAMTVPSSNVFGGVKFGTSSKAKPTSKVGLFGKGIDQTSSTSTVSSFGTTMTSGTTQTGMSYLGSLLSAGGSGTSGHFGGTGLFGKKEKPDRSDQQSRGLFGKPRSQAQDVSTTVVTIKQEPPGGRSSLFGKPVTSSETGGATKKGLFGRGGSGSQQTSSGGSESKPADFKFQASQGAGQVKQEKQDVKQETSRSGGLFGKPDTKNPQSTHGLFGKLAPKDELESENFEGREFRPRLSRVTEEPVAGTSRTLFGKPVLQTAKPRRGSDEALRSRHPSVSRQLSSDVSKVAIICRNVPSKFNNHTTLRNHFSRFGHVTKVFPNASKMQASIHFQTHEAAAEAKRRGRMIARGYPPMSIFWSAYSAPSPKESTDSRGRSRDSDSRSREEVPGTSRAYPPRQRASGLDDELESMSGSSDFSYDSRKSSPPPRPRETGSNTPEKRVRSASPGPSTAVDVKSDKVVHMGSFQGAVARTTTEQVQLLNQRDKFIRLNRKKKQTDISKARAFVGTCPDMCPEKERYDREDKRRLSYYEMIPGTENIPGRNPAVDHCRAVKEYLRSSPDQDEPLPHELRPMPVLEMTMTYLLCEVADQGQEGFWGDWFDFLWNRTRGIRKDITQQQLSDRRAVGLIEKCARFHIFCSERLCEEDMHSFDAKINNENLTKCLQTLREFYHDLEKKQKSFCENEAEFRAYTVLMNLNEGDILREVQQLRPEVRNSPAISFALQVYAALNNNNYVRFFRLVKQSSFSNACIMHRYFTQVRNRALTTMMRTYGMGNKPAQIHLAELVRLLGFENEQEASDFCKHYGFTFVEGDVILDRSEYLEPDMAWLPQRSVHLIESKRMVSVGEMINGGPLPKFEIHTPSSSFDAQGRFNSAVELPGGPAAPIEPASTEARSQAEIKQEPVAAPVKSEPSVPEAPPKIIVSNENVKDLAKLLFWEVIDEKSKEISHEMMAEVEVLLDISNSVLENTVYSTVKDLLHTVSREVYDDAQAEHQRLLKQEREERRDRVAEALTDEFLDEVVKQQALNLATIEIREVKAQLRRECISRVTEDINVSLVEEVISEMVQDCAEDVFETDVTQRLKQLQEFEDIVKLSRAGKFLQRWKKEYKAVTKLKRAMMAFPSSAAMETVPDQVDRLLKNCRDESVSDSRFFVNKRARLTIETPVDVDRRWRNIDTQMSVHTLYQKLLVERAWQHLDVSKLVGQKLIEKLKSDKKGKKNNNLNWKLVMFLPETGTANDLTSRQNIATAELCDWLEAKMSKGKRPPAEKIIKTEVLSLYKSIVSSRGSKPQTTPVSLGICVRSITGLPSEDELIMLDEERCMLGTDGVIFVLPADPPLTDLNSKYWHSNLQRLQELLEIKPTCQAYPLVIVVGASANQNVSYDCLSECLNLDHFIDQGFICDVKIVVLDINEQLRKGINVVDPRISEKLCESIQWLADLSYLAPDISVSYLKDCVQGFLMEEYYTPVLQNLRKRKKLGYFHQSPDLLLELYNSVIQHLSDTLTSESLVTISWPVSEFTKRDDIDTPPPYWNTDDQFEYLNQLFQSLRLPQFVSFFYQPDNWPLVRQNVSNFVNSVADKEYGPARVQMTSRLKALLHKVEVDFEETCYLTEGVDQCQPTYNNIPWVDVMAICIDYKLATFDVMDPNVNTQDGSGGELKVAFLQSELQTFVPPQVWRHIESDKSILSTPSVNTVVHKAAEKLREKLAETTVSPKTVVVVEQENLPPELKETSTSSQKLIKSLQAERRRSDHFQKYLENALKSDQEERATLSEYFDELPSDINFHDKSLGDSSVFENTLRTESPSGIKRKEFSMTDNAPDISMGTKLFGNQTIHFNEESCFGSPEHLKRVEKTVTLKRKSLGHVPQNSKRLSLDIPKVSGNDDTDDNQSKIRESKLGLDFTTLPARTRRQRLSEVYGDDKVMLSLCEPTFSEDLSSLKDELKANRRDSDLFEKKLLSILQNDSFSNESY